MMQGNSIVVILVALVVGFAAGFVLRPIFDPAAARAGAAPAAASGAPHGTQYFAAHLDEARTVVAGCGDGSVRGDECANADMAIKIADGRARTKKFLGDRPR